MGPAVEIRGVSKGFPQGTPLFPPWRRRPKIHALDRVDLEIERGTILALLGPNGAGKTTLLKILATLLLPDEGEIWVNGYHFKREARQIRKTLSFAMGKERSFYRRLTARQNLEFFAALYNLSKKRAKQKIRELAETFGFTAHLDRPFETLSTGICQCLGIARSFLNGASILLADEPTRSLDPLRKRELKALLKRLAREWGKTILFTTHDLHEAEELGDKIGILYQGRLQWFGTPEELRAEEGEENLEAAVAQICRDERVPAFPA